MENNPVLYIGQIVDYGITCMNITETLRKAVKDSDESRYRIAKNIAADGGLDERSLGRFVKGELSPTSAKLDVLADYFGFVLVRKSETKKSKPSSAGKRRA